MTIQDTQSTFGSWSIRLRTEAELDDKGNLLPAAPQELLDLFAITDGPNAFLGHVIVTSQAFNLDEIDVISKARYTGVLRESRFSSTDVEISGSGLVYWLGDLQERGPIFRNELILDNASFADGIAAILPPAITTGTIVPEVGAADAAYLFVTARAALEDWLSLFGAEYYITPQGELNAGTPASLFPSFNNPTTFILRKGSGADENLKPLPLSSATMSGDMTNFATKVVSLVQVEETSFLEGEADLSPPTSKRDLHGNLVDITDINNESSTLAQNVDARAAARLAQISVPRQAVELSTENYDIHGDFIPGDSVWVYDVAAGLYDLANEVEFNGQTYWPVKLRVLEISYPVSKGMGVYFRAPDLNGTLYDLTPYFVPEPEGTSQIVVSQFSRSLIPPSSGGIGGVITPILNPDTSPPPQPDPPTVVGDVQFIQVVHPLTSGGNPFPATVTHLEVHVSTTSGFTPDGTSYVGDITTAPGAITLGTPVVKSFETPSDVQRYVRVIAVKGGQNVDPSARYSPASTQVAVTPGLIPSANIISLVADKIAAGTITAAISILSPHIIGGIIETAPSGQRVALEEGAVDRIKWYTGDASESVPAFTQSAVLGSGSTRSLYLIAQSPRFTADASRGQMGLQSRQQGGGGEAGAGLSVLGPTGTVLSNLALFESTVELAYRASSRRLVLTATTSNLLYGSSSTEPFIQLAATAAVIGRGATTRRLVIDGVSFSFIGLDNVTKFQADDVNILAWRNVVLNDWEMRFRAAGDNNHYLRYNASIDGPEMRGQSRFWIRAFAADVGILANGGAIEVGNYGNTAGRDVFASDFLPWSDARLKSEITDLTDAEVGEAFRKLRPKRYKRDGKTEVGFIAQDAPASARRPGLLGGKPTEALSLRTLAALHWGQTVLLGDRVEELAAQVESLKESK